MVIDLVCGMGVEENDPATLFQRFQGERFFFCSPECLSLFTIDPLRYINKNSVEGSLTKDPVCGMIVDTTNPPFFTQYGGRTYYFCSRACLIEFERRPEDFTHN